MAGVPIEKATAAMTIRHFFMAGPLNMIPVIANGSLSRCSGHATVHYKIAMSSVAALGRPIGAMAPDSFANFAAVHSETSWAFGL